MITCKDIADKIQERKNFLYWIKKSLLSCCQKTWYFIKWYRTWYIRCWCILSQSCHIIFFTNPVKLTSKNDLQKSKTQDILDLFKYRIKTKLTRHYEAYWLHELLKDIKFLSEEHDLETPVIEHTSSLKRYLVQEYFNDITFFLFTLSISTHWNISWLWFRRYWPY